jgi:transposase
MSQKPRNHSPDFKAKVALATIKGSQILSEIASRYAINANLVVKWKKQLLA